MTKITGMTRVTGITKMTRVTRVTWMTRVINIRRLTGLTRMTAKMIRMMIRMTWVDCDGNDDYNGWDDWDAGLDDWIDRDD